MLRLFLIISFTIMSSIFIFSQEENKITKPIEFPTIILEGKEQLNIQSGTKQFPEKTNNLSRSDLDSINPLDKQQSLLLPPKPFPNTILHPLIYDGFVSGELGRYYTRKLEGSYSLKYQGYRILGLADYDGSSGFIKNSNYNKFNLLLTSDYIAPSKYWIFGGSRTAIDISYGYKDYNLYSTDLAPNRTSNVFNASISSKGAYQDFSFLTGAGFKTFNMKDLSSKSNDNDLNAFLQLENGFGEYRIGGKADLHFRNLSGRSLHFFNLLGIVKDNSNNSLIAGFQSAVGSDGAEHINLYIDLNTEYKLDKDFTLRGKIFNGYEDINFYDFYQVNPYISDSAEIKYGNSFKAVGAIHYQPNERLTCLASITFLLRNNFPMFQSRDTTHFDLLYAKFHGFIFNIESYWNFTKSDKAVLKLNLNSYDNNGNSPTYMPSIVLNVDWQRKWTDKFMSQIGFNYMGRKFADSSNKKSIDGWLGINLLADYSITPTFSVFCKIQNLINSNIILWDRYKERDLYFSAGLQWKFK
jgi:hypothetical protein